MNQTGKITAIVQARMTSTRLPGKVLLDLAGKPMLIRQIERLRQSQLLEQIVVATSVSTEDDAIVEVCQKNQITVTRGDLNDVLKRYWDSARSVNADPIVRVTADCPLIDPDVLDQLIAHFQKNKDTLDYVSNCYKATYPDGLDVSVFSFRILDLAYREASLPSEREHVVPWMWKQSNLEGGSRFKAENLPCPVDLSSLRWTVDEPKDFELITQIYDRLYSANPNFRMKHVLELLADNPSLTEINSGILRNEGYFKSLMADAKTTVNTLKK